MFLVFDLDVRSLAMAILCYISSFFIDKLPEIVGRRWMKTSCKHHDCWLQIQEAERRQLLLVDVLRKEQEHRQRLVSRFILLKPGFHYPSWRPVNSGAFFWHQSCRQLGCIFWHPSTRAVNSGVKKCTRVHGPSTRPMNSGSGNRALFSILYCSMHCSVSVLYCLMSLLFLCTAEAWDITLGVLLSGFFVSAISRDLQKTSISNFSRKQHVVGVRSMPSIFLNFYIFFWKNMNNSIFKRDCSISDFACEDHVVRGQCTSIFCFCFCIFHKN